MTDQEIKEQIENTVELYCSKIPNAYERGYAISLLESQLPIQDKIATNRTVEAAISSVKSLFVSDQNYSDRYSLACRHVLQELEKLRRV
jgi:hypothetical protein